MSSKPKSVAVTPKMRAQKSIAATATVVPSVVPSFKSTTNNNTPFDKNRMLELRKQRNQSIAAAGGMANLSFFSGRMMEAFKQTGRTPDKKLSQTTSDNPEAFRNFLSSKMLEAVNVTKQSGGGVERPRGRPKKGLGKEPQLKNTSGELQRSAISDPNDYVTPVFSFDGSSILDMVLAENLSTEESPLNNSDDEMEDIQVEVKIETQPETSLNQIEVNEKSQSIVARPSSSGSISKKPFQLRPQLRLKPKKKIEPPRIKVPRQVGEVSDIRQQLLSKFSQVTSSSAKKPEVVSVVASKPAIKTAKPSTSKNVKSVKKVNLNFNGSSSSRPSSVSVKKITPVAIRSTPRCSLSKKKPSKQNISVADPSRKMVGAVQFMLSSAITKVLQTPPSSKKRKSSTPSQSSTTKQGRPNSSSIPIGYGRPTRPPVAHVRSKKRAGSDEGSSSEEDLGDDGLVKPWELENEEEDSSNEQFEEGPCQVDDVKIEVVNDDEDEDEQEMTSHDPLDMPYDTVEQEQNVKIEVTNDEYNAPFFEGFEYEEEGTEEKRHCDYDGNDNDQAVIDIKPDVSSQAVVETAPIEISSEIVKTEPQENIISEFIM